MLWGTHTQCAPFWTDKISVPLTFKTPFYNPCDQKCSCCTTSQWGKCNTYCFTPEVLDTICLPTDQIHYSDVCGMQKELWKAICHARSTSSCKVTSQPHRPLYCNQRWLCWSLVCLHYRGGAYGLPLSLHMCSIPSNSLGDSQRPNSGMFSTSLS